MQISDTCNIKNCCFFCSIDLLHLIWLFERLSKNVITKKSNALEVRDSVFLGLCRYISINRLIPGFFAVWYGSFIGLAAYRYKGKHLKLKISNIVIWVYCCWFFSFRHFVHLESTPVLEVSSCNFLTFLLMLCFLNDESLKCIKYY